MKDLYKDQQAYIEDLKKRVRVCDKRGYMDKGTYYELIYLKEFLNIPHVKGEESGLLEWLDTHIKCQPIGALTPFKWYSKHKSKVQEYSTEIETEAVGSTVLALVLSSAYLIYVTILAYIFDNVSFLRKGGILYLIILLLLSRNSSDYRTVLNMVINRDKIARDPFTRNKVWLTEMCNVSEVSPKYLEAVKLRKELDDTARDTRMYYILLARIELLYNNYMLL